VSQGRLAHLAGRAASLLFVAALLLLVGPQSLGGPVAYVRVDGHSMDHTYATGDLIVVRRQRAYRPGDVVSYRIPRGEFGAGAQVIHRIVGGTGAGGFVTRGDNKPLVDPWHPRTGDVVGRAWIRLPGAGGPLTALQTPVVLGGLCAALTVVAALWPSRRPTTA
jgi:signal peptidase